MVVIGNSTVGKTSITNCFIENYFNEKEKKSTMVKVQRKSIVIEGTEKLA